MRSLSFTFMVLLISFLFSAGLLRQASAHVPDPCDGLREWPFFVGDQPADVVVAGLRAGPRIAVQDFINGLGIDIPMPDLVDILQQLDESPLTYKGSLPQALQGIGGLTTTLLLQKLLPLDAEPIADKIFYGKIRDFTYLEATGEGHLAVDICIDRREFVPLGEDHREFFHWDIEVAKGGFAVEPRTPPGVPTDQTAYGDPFPNLNITMPAMAIDPSDPKSIWRRGLDHKLYARGMTITVRNIYWRKLSDPDLVRLSESDTDLYESTMASCIDLFTEGPPPATFGELSGSGYCLGRCANPPIVNSGD
jgi:hypothetical protein